jgi:hypothetical protein
VTHSHDEAIPSPGQTLTRYLHPQGWRLLPAREFLDAGVRGARLARPARDRLRAWAQRGEGAAVVGRSPDHAARDSAHQGLPVEESAKWPTRWLVLQRPLGAPPQGEL